MDNYVEKLFSPFDQTFPNEDACQDRLRHIRENRSLSLCAHCDSQREPTISRERGKSKCRDCRKETALTFGTAFYCSKVSLRMWFKLIWAWIFLPRHSNCIRLSQLIDLPPSTTLGCLKRLRTVLAQLPKEPLNGDVAMDVIYNTTGHLTNYHNPYKIEGVILVAVKARKNGAGQLRMLTTQKFDLEAYEGFQLENVTPTSKIQRGITLKKNTGECIDEKSPPLPSESNFSSLPAIEKVAIELDRWLWQQYHGAVSTSLDWQGYLDEFCFRWNNKYKIGAAGRVALFESVLKGTVDFTSGKREKIVE